MKDFAKILILVFVFTALLPDKGYAGFDASKFFFDDEEGEKDAESETTEKPREAGMPKIGGIQEKTKAKETKAKDSKASAEKTKSSAQDPFAPASNAPTYGEKQAKSSSSPQEQQEGAASKQGEDDTFKQDGSDGSTATPPGVAGNQNDGSGVPPGAAAPPGAATSSAQTDTTSGGSQQQGQQATSGQKQWEWDGERYKTEPMTGRSPEEILKYDIAGVKLGMSLEEGVGKAKETGFKVVSNDFYIPDFLSWKYEAACRASGEVYLRQINACINELAKKDNTIYISTIYLEKSSTREKLSIFLTSEYTDNKVYKVKYEAQSDPSVGISKKSMYLKRLRTKEFWQRVVAKYGTPDDDDSYLWGKGQGYPYLIASNGKLVLEDPRLNYMDSRKMIAADRKTGSVGNFTF